MNGPGRDFDPVRRTGGDRYPPAAHGDAAAARNDPPPPRADPPPALPPRLGPPTDRFSREIGPPDFTVSPRDRRRPSLTQLGVVVAVVLATVALVIAVIAMSSLPEPAHSAGTPSPQAVTDADKALCQAIGPLMKENDDRSNAFLGTGEAGSPERDAALPKFVSDTRDWARRTQQALDGHASPSRFSTRALQRYIDDMLLFVASVRTGPGTQYDEAAWTDSIVAYGGALTVCQQLGINW